MRRNSELLLICSLSVIVLVATSVAAVRRDTATQDSAALMQPGSAQNVVTVLSSAPTLVLPTATAEDTAHSAASDSVVSQPVVAGERISAPALEYLPDVSLIGLDAPPITTLDALLETMRHSGLTAPWMPGVTLVNADYGAGTWGMWVNGEDGTVSWLGPTGIELRNGERLERVENRPVWLLTFDVRATTDTPGPILQTYLVDARTGEPLFIATLEAPLQHPPIDGTVPPEGIRPQQ
jgi:hypothetical protein